jgi:hypothetical protein
MTQWKHCAQYRTLDGATSIGIYHKPWCENVQLDCAQTNCEPLRDEGHTHRTIYGQNAHKFDHGTPLAQRQLDNTSPRVKVEG